jgi:hypothetical protein
VQVIDPGHDYWLNELDGGYPQPVSRLTFVKREGPNFPGNVGSHQGTTSQEVLRALIQRAEYVYNQIPCWETRLSVFLMGLVIWLYEHRAAKRHHRKSPRFYDATFGKTCPQCGHVGCVAEEHKR